MRRDTLWILIGIVAAGAVFAAWLFLYRTSESPVVDTFTKSFDAIANDENLPSESLRELVFGAQPLALNGGTRNDGANLWFTYATSTPVDELFTDYQNSLPRMGWTITDSVQNESNATLTLIKKNYPNPRPVATITIQTTDVGAKVSLSVDNLEPNQ